MRLILGTHSRKGVEVFRDVHGKVELSEIQTRNTISRSETGQLGLWSQAEESVNQQRAVGVGSACQQAAARRLISGALANGAARFDDIAVLVMEQCAMRLTSTKDLLVAMRKEGIVAFDLLGRTKKPQPETIICATEA